MKKIVILFAFALLAVANEALPLHILPHDCNVGKAAAAHHGGGMKSAMYQLLGYEGDMSAEVKYIFSTLESKDLKLDANMINLPRSGSDNYHAIVANVSRDNNFYSAIYYTYNHGKPSQTSPTKLTTLNKSKFEIHPYPLPREHDRYTSSKEYKFKVSFDGKPTQVKVQLQTLNGTIVDLQSDEKGMLTFTLPNDFTDVKMHRRQNMPSYFILAAQTQKDGSSYSTTLSAPYHVNPTDYWQSVTYGIITLIMGVVIGLFLYRRSQKNG